MRTPERLRADLATAMRSRDKVETSTIRTLIAAIENAEAIEAELSVDPKIGFNHDQQRRNLTDEDIARIVKAERDDVSGAVDEYRRLGLGSELEEMEHRLRIVDRYVS